MNKLLEKIEWCGEDDCNKCGYVDFEPGEDMNYCTLYQMNVKYKDEAWHFVRWVDYLNDK